jgi:2-polyprenyl-3-methyl-5-hydroxy-6-metoxy-1,4-benzoquinol methylase
MFKQNTDQAWEYYGKENPYYGVLTSEKFKRENLDNKNLNDFFRSGQIHIELILSIIHKHFDLNFKANRALDFGCGVGRLLVALAKVCDQAVGVDVSQSMLLEAERNCKNFNINNVSFALSDDDLSQVLGTFDLIHSYIVLQHIPTVRGEKIVQNLIDKLNDGGVGVLHFTYYRDASWLHKFLSRFSQSIPLLGKLRNIIKNVPVNAPLMQMNIYNLNKLYQILQAYSSGNIFSLFTNHQGMYGIIIFFQKNGQPTFFDSFS